MEVNRIKFARSAKTSSIDQAIQLKYASHARWETSNEIILNKIRLPITRQTNLKMRSRKKQSRFIARVSVNLSLKTAKNSMYNRFRRQKLFSRSPQCLKSNMRWVTWRYLHIFRKKKKRSKRIHQRLFKRNAFLSS